MALETAQRQVRELHDAFKRDRAAAPEIVRPKLNRRLVKEETKEVLAAIDRRDVVNLAQELVDLIYSCVSVAESCGIDLAPVWSEIHSANMRKVGGPVRADGKILKPPGWKPANVEAVLRAQGWKGERKKLSLPKRAFWWAVSQALAVWFPLAIRFGSFLR